MAGALSQAQGLDDTQDDAPTNSRGVSMRRRSALDQATQRMIADLQRTAPLEAQAAAMFGQNPQGSLPGALGAGMAANLRTRLGMVTLPYDVRQKSAESDLMEARAAQLELQNQINELNFGYLTEPYSQSPQADGTAAPPQPGSGPVPPAGAPPPASPGAGGGGGAPPGMTGAPPAGGAQMGNDQHLPLTQESQMQLEALHAQLQRAAQYINKSPQARTDYFTILHEMTQVVQNDPLAKQALQQSNTQQTSDVDLDKQIRLQIAKMGDEAHHEAESQFSAMANAPNSQVNISDPNAVNRWIDERARGIFASRFAMLSGQLQRMGLDPMKYLGRPEGAPIGQEQLPPQITAGGPPGPAPAAAPAPGEGPPAPLSGTPAPAAEGDLSGSPFGPRQLGPKERVEVNKDQGAAAGDLATLMQAQKDLEMALEINGKSLAGPLVEYGQMAHRLRDTVKGVFGLDRNDPELKNTALLDSIFSGQTLSNLKNLMRGNPTEAERGYVERVGAVKQLTQQERQVLIERGLELIQPRIAFERMRNEALSRGQTVDPKSYETWLRQSWPEAEKVLKE